MIKTVFLIAALLVPGLAHAGNPSAPFSDQVVPAAPTSGVACDVGPNAPNIPAPAQAAGFTHCALNADWSTNTTDAHGVNWSNPNTWASNCGASPTANNDTWFNVWYALAGPDTTVPPGGPNVAVPCNRINIITDSTYGNQALDIALRTSDWNTSSNTGWWIIELDWPGDAYAPCGGHICGMGPSHNGLYQQVYLEWEMRLLPSSFNNTTSESIDDWWYDNMCIRGSCSPSSGNYGNREIDFFETNVSRHNSSTDQTCGVTSLQPDWCWGPTAQYHRFGHLVTSDGTTRAQCAYVDGGIDNNTPASCGSAVLNTGSGYYGYYATDWILGECIGPGTGSPNYTGPGCMTHDIEKYYKHLRIFACANYWNQNCNGKPITSSVEKPVRYASWKDPLKWVGKFFGINPAAAQVSAVPSPNGDPFSSPWEGLWTCPAGKGEKFDITLECPPPPEFKGDWWSQCLPNRSDCVHSDTAYIGIDREIAKRGPGFCYTEQPYTCSAEGKLPP